ncbi:hypothetical protein [Paraburkholderia sp. BL6669N2]|uniref:hypothetical protein n=1 Tax=Paraburkholderia sp. BL6669N2 TaxID=1938807 RepID=UPI0011C07D8F|nr:hypothetical protein [Paraburkholderia sp. BL6669N2]
MIWPLDGSTPVQSTTASMTPTLASQITVSQFQIPFTGTRLEKIPPNGIYSLKPAAGVPLYGLRKIPMNH